MKASNRISAPDALTTTPALASSSEASTGPTPQKPVSLVVEWVGWYKGDFDS